MDSRRYTISLLLTANMAGTIKLFSFDRKYYHIFGIYPPQSSQNGPSFNSRNWIFVFSHALLFFPSAGFFVHDAESMLEYGISFLAASIAVAAMIVYLSMIRQMKNIWPFIENCERFIKKSECLRSVVQREIQYGSFWTFPLQIWTKHYHHFYLLRFRCV